MLEGPVKIGPAPDPEGADASPEAMSIIVDPALAREAMKATPPSSTAAFAWASSAPKRGVKHVCWGQISERLNEPPVTPSIGGQEQKVPPPDEEPPAPLPPPPPLNPPPTIPGPAPTSPPPQTQATAEAPPGFDSVSAPPNPPPAIPGPPPTPQQASVADAVRFSQALRDNVTPLVLGARKTGSYTHAGAKFFLYRPETEVHPLKVIMWWPGCDDKNPWNLKKYSHNPGRCEYAKTYWQSKYFVVCPSYDGPKSPQPTLNDRTILPWEVGPAYGTYVLARALWRGGHSTVHVGYLTIISSKRRGPGIGGREPGQGPGLVAWGRVGAEGRGPYGSRTGAGPGAALGPGDKGRRPWAGIGGRGRPGGWGPCGGQGPGPGAGGGPARDFC